MAGTGRPRGRPRKDASKAVAVKPAVKKTAKPTGGRNKKVQSSEEEPEEETNSSHGASDREEKKAPIRQYTTRRGPRVQGKAPTGSEWVPIEQEAEEDDDFIDDGPDGEEEEDELEDEGESVNSDIDNLDSSPDHVAFTRPSTSPVRVRTGITLATPPTPSPTKKSNKRMASLSPEPNNRGNDDKEPDVSPPCTPVKARKTRTKKSIKSQEIIEDSDIEEVVKSDHNQAITLKGRNKGQGIDNSTKTAVKMLDKKITVRGTKFPSAPVEDADHNPLLDSPPSRSPKKKQRRCQLSESEEDVSDGDLPLANMKSANTSTPVTKLSGKLKNSVIDSAKKPTAVSSRNWASNPHLLQLAAALSLTPVRNYFCSALGNTYGDIRPANVRGISLCNPIQITWFTLRQVLTDVSIAEGTRQERDLIQLMTTPAITPFLYNPARCHVKDFTYTSYGQGKSERHFILQLPEKNKVCFIMYGTVNVSALVELRMMGQGPWHNRSISVFPIAPEITLAYSFFSKFITGVPVNNFGGFISFSSFPTSPDRNPTNTYKGTASAPPPGQAGPVLVDMHAGEDNNTLLDDVLRKGIDMGGLKSTSIVPVFDVTSQYGCTSPSDIPHDLDTFVAMCVRNPRWVGEVPTGALVGVIAMPGKHPHLDHTDMGFNLLAVVVLATPYNTHRA